MKSLSVKLLLIMLISVASGNIFAQDNMSDMKNKIQQWNDEFSKAMVNNDEEKMLSFYADDAISLPSYAPMIKGKEAMRSADNNMEPSKINSFNLTSKEVFGDDKYVFDIGTYKMSVQNKKEDGSMNDMDDEGKYLTVYEKQSDGSWKIKADMWNTNMNPWKMMDKDNDMGMDKDKMNKQ